MNMKLKEFICTFDVRVLNVAMHASVYAACIGKYIPILSQVFHGRFGVNENVWGPQDKNLKTWVSNLRPESSVRSTFWCYATCDHMSKLCIYYKHLQ